MTKTTETDAPILLFDGVCNLCNGAVQTLIKIDKQGVFRLAALQSDAGQALLRKFGLPEKGFKTFVLVEDDAVFTRSDAVIEIGRYLGGAWRLLRVLKIVPRPARDFIYDIISENRYKWFGKRPACMIPTPDIKRRFLD